MGARRNLVLLGAVALLTGPPSAWGQGEPNPDISGTWNLQMSVLLEGEEQPCVYVGTVEASQVDSVWQGPAELGLVTGPAACPAEMIGDLTGNLETEGGVTTITGFIDGGEPTGAADFSGTITPNPGGTGTFAVSEGSFAGEEGTWLAELRQSLLEIPALAPAGLTVLTLLLLAGGAWLLSRQASA